METIIFSIDDFYKTLNERENMSKSISSLFLTRGVPGTHDTKLLQNTFKGLLKKNFKPISIPRFDKSTDDRVNKKIWLKIKKKPVKMFGSGGATNEFKNILEKKKIFGSKVTKNNLRIDILNLENSHFNISKYFKFSIVF